MMWRAFATTWYLRPPQVDIQLCLQAFIPTVSETTGEVASSVLNAAGPHCSTVPPLLLLAWHPEPCPQPPTVLPWHVSCSPWQTHRQVVNLSLADPMRPVPWTAPAGGHAAQQLSNTPSSMCLEVGRSHSPAVCMARFA